MNTKWVSTVEKIFFNLFFVSTMVMRTGFCCFHMEKLRIELKWRKRRKKNHISILSVLIQFYHYERLTEIFIFVIFFYVVSICITRQKFHEGPWNNRKTFEWKYIISQTMCSIRPESLVKWQKNRASSQSLFLSLSIFTRWKLSRRRRVGEATIFHIGFGNIQCIIPRSWQIFTSIARSIVRRLVCAVEY